MTLPLPGLAFVYSLCSNFVFADSSKHFDDGQYAEAIREVDRLIHDVCDTIIKLKPRLDRIKLKQLDILQFFLELKDAFTGDKENLIRVSEVVGVAFAIDLNQGVNAGLTKFFEYN